MNYEFMIINILLVWDLKEEKDKDDVIVKSMEVTNETTSIDLWVIIKWQIDLFYVILEMFIVKNRY